MMNRYYVVVDNENGKVAGTYQSKENAEKRISELSAPGFEFICREAEACIEVSTPNGEYCGRFINKVTAVKWVAELVCGDIEAMTKYYFDEKAIIESETMDYVAEIDNDF